MLSTLGFVAIALLVLSLLVVVHEFGHFIAAKLVGVWPEEFGIGLPPRVWGKKIGETIWSINALPLGGFVRLHGEVAEAHLAKPERAFTHKSKLARGFVALAGVFMNMVFAVLAFGFIFFMTGIPQGIKVDTVAENSPAAAIGLESGDVIQKIDWRPLYNPGFFGQIVADHAGKSLTVTYEKAETKELVQKNFVLRAFPPEGQGLLGVTYNMQSATYWNPQGLQRVTASLHYGALQTYDFTVLILKEFGKMFTQIFTGNVPSGLTGPLGVVGVTAQAAKQGFLDLVGFAALISINLAIINVVPFPPLDGSRILFLFIEMIVGKRRLPKIEEKVHMVGMYLILILVAFLTFREVPKLLTSGSLEGFVSSLIK